MTDVTDWEMMVGERIQEWIDKNFTYENGLKREPTEEDYDIFGGEDVVSWVFTQKGQRLYESYLSKVNRLAYKKFPNEPYFDIYNYTGIIEP